MPATVGVEEELLVVDGVDGHLVPRAQDVLAALDPEIRPHVGGELNHCQIELGTPVCTTLSELESSLRALRNAIAEAATSVGCAVLPSGSHPFSTWAAQAVRREVPRFAAMEDRYRLLADEQVICGAHFHVGLGDRDTDVAVMRRVRPWLPVLLALSANSPCWEGRDSGYASYRSEVWKRWPTASFPPDVGGTEEYNAVIEELIAADVIPDATYLYWYLRPSDRYDTLECRICDVPLRVRDTVTVAGLFRGLACTYAGEASDRRPPLGHDMLEAALWRAARYGVQDHLMDPRTRRPAPARQVVTALLEEAAPGLEHHRDADRVAAGLWAILDEGTGADVQRRALAGGENGFEVVRDLVHLAAT